MRLLVLSDSHGDVENMVRAVEQTGPELIFHLGDGWRDVEELRMLCPRIPIEQVPGNCDFRPNEPLERLLFPADRRVLLCHGHTYGVKQSLLRAAYTAEEQGLDLFLFGHTHQPLWDWRGRTLFINPGSIGQGFRPTYALVELEADRIGGRIYTL